MARTPTRTFLRLCREVFLFVPYVLYWLGLWNLLDTQIVPTHRVARNIAYTLVGVLWLSFRRVFILRSDSAEKERQRRRRNVVLIKDRFYCGVKVADACKSLLDETGCVIGWTGLWSLLDAVKTSGILTKEVPYVLVGSAAFIFLDITLRDESLSYCSKKCTKS